MNLSYEARLPAAEEFFALFATTGWNDEYHLTAEELHAAISLSWHALSVYKGTRLIGFGRVVSDGVLHAMIYDLIVLPEYRGKGIGAEILRRLVETCRDAGIRDVQLFAARGRRAVLRAAGLPCPRRRGAGDGLQGRGPGALNQFSTREEDRCRRSATLRSFS